MPYSVSIPKTRFIAAQHTGTALVRRKLDGELASGFRGRKITGFKEIHQLRPIDLVVIFRPMSLDPSFNQILDQAGPAPDPAAALQALLVVSPDGRIQFATARADLG